jgi:surface antigen
MILRRNALIVSLLFAATALSACTTTKSSSSGGMFSSDSDKQRALEAEYRALESAAVGQPVVWSGRKISGKVVAAAPYQVGSQNCRQYTHTLTADGKDTVTRGAACRNNDGSWSPLG